MHTAPDYASASWRYFELPMPCSAFLARGRSRYAVAIANLFFFLQLRNGARKSAGISRAPQLHPVFGDNVKPSRRRTQQGDCRASNHLANTSRVRAQKAPKFADQRCRSNVCRLHACSVAWWPHPAFRSSASSTHGTHGPP